MNGFASIPTSLVDATLPQQIFWGIGLLGIALIVVQSVLALVIGHHGDIPSDANTGSGDHGGFAAYLSIRCIAAILLGFGFGGAYLDRTGVALGFAALGGLALGLLIGTGYVVLVSSLNKLRSDGAQLQLTDAVSRTGRVYLPIPAESTGAGEIQVAFGGRLNNVPAFTQGPPLPVGTFVRITGLRGEKAVEVEKTEDSQP